jgi:glycosyltransferase involved in cell wall biosynthesis
MDEPKPLVSVIMSVHNGEEWLDDAIRSIMHQTYANWEFIIVDDASDQPAQDILKKYETDPRFKITRQPVRRGLTKNLNASITQCRGKYIARMDADDVSLPQRLEKQVAYLESHPEADLVAGFVEFIDENGQPKGTWKDDRNTVSDKQIKQLLPWRNCIAHPSVMFRNELMKVFKYNEEQTHSQDWDLWFQLADAGKQFAKIPETLMLYRVHSGSTTASSNRGFALRKMQQSYKIYLRSLKPGNKFSPFNRKVKLAFWFNTVKLFLSRIKRLFTS